MQEIVVHNEVSSCPYLGDRVARMPLRLPLGMSAVDLDRKLASGYRRSGQFIYRTQCPACTACEPIRIPLRDFAPRRTQRRTLRKGNELLTVRVAPPTCDAQRVDLYNRHKHQRGLAAADAGDIAAEDYRAFLVDTCCDSWEFSYWCGEQLVAVAISDRGDRALNAVYCYFEPNFTAVSLGTYNVLKQAELARAWELEYLYLGFYIADSPHMNYKAIFVPHERRLDGRWQRFDRAIERGN
jgi:arginyl-tRNA--protein-N-Asp/Glu arginylyltransferase